ncbi:MULTISPECIES: RNA polymerase sigma factor [Spirosoma]|uniref:Sigma-70 family RNA polymerase sigma factor n=1 Tax=Spirosoma liriopis TaxID=2937440 RepID=A0ABT0HF80_9BACT|nr:MULTISPECIES: sigma-70 family RNA polymerase sigma factor [Spirosoma]MCK8490814.1 sigma-70 family RNA polymerase sigma factor [Spirosoma liriopis]UHG90200.1 sigma-70 family RNA polymerase sigma factor [Spirosoma oryzicola]
MKESRRPVLTDDELLAGLATGSDDVLNQLYRRYFPMVLHLVTSNSGSEDDAKDIYQEAIVVLYEKVQSGSLELHCQLKTYLYSVGRRLWLKQLTQRNRFLVRDVETPAVDDDAGQQIDSDLNEHEERDRQFDLMADSLEKLGEPCRTLLEDFYIRHLSMQAITDKFGYTNADNAKTQKYKCLMRLKRLFFSEYKQN